MALNPNDSAAYGMYKAVKDSESVFGPTNKSNMTGGGLDGEGRDEYESSMTDDEIVKLTDSWKKTYKEYYKDIEQTQKRAFDYWLGRQTQSDLTVTGTTSDPNPLTDNVIFTAVETFLPLATRANPDPVVSTNPEAQEVGHAIHATLVYEADRQQLRRKNARLIRTWIWNRIGVVRMHWDYETKKICTEIVNGKNMIFDADGHVDESGIFKGDYFGERKKEVASKLLDMFPKKKKEIEEIAKGNMGTKLNYISWWYRDTDNFYTLEQQGRDPIVLGKYKNPNWNYDIPEEESQQPVIDEVSGVTVHEGKDYQPAQEGINFFDKPQAPYLFLSIFSSGTKPHDETSLILQNIPMQDVINKTLRQIDFNVKSMNNSLAVSGKSFTDDQASNAANAAMRGQAILVPDGNVEGGIKRLPPPGLPDTVFDHMNNARSELMNIFGTSGSTPESTANQDTVRGKIMVQQQDTSRIGGTITEQLEQVDDSIYQYWVQMMFVFYDDEHLIASAGQEGGMEIISIRNSMFPIIKTLDITVKEGSLIPKDPLTQRNEAMDMWANKSIDPLEYFKRLDVPDPAEATTRLMLWNMYLAGQISAQQYLPSFVVPPPQAPQGVPPQGGQPPTVSAEPQGQPPTPPSSPPAVESEMSNLIKSVPEPKI